MDFDFFSSEPVDFEKLFAIAFVRDADVLQRDFARLTVPTPRTGSSAPIRLSFFGGLDLGRGGHPERTDDGVAGVAATLDLFATRLKVLPDRVAARDYVDVAAVLRSGIPYEDGLGAAVALHGSQFPPKVAPNRFFHAGAARRLAEVAEGLAAASEDGRYDARAFRNRSGIVRNLTIQVLEYFDVAGLARRIGNTSIVVRRSVRPLRLTRAAARPGSASPGSMPRIHRAGTPGPEIRSNLQAVHVREAGRRARSPPLAHCRNVRSKTRTGSAARPEKPA